MSAFPSSAAFVAVLAVGTWFAPQTFAAEATDRRVAVRPGVADAMLARSALAALDADPQLREVNLVVSVVDRVAVLGGSVPSDDHARRATGVVRRVVGIADVRNRCFVQATADPLIRAVTDRLSPPPVRRPPNHELPGMVRPPRPAESFPDGSSAPGGTALAATPIGPKPVVALKIPTESGRRPSLLLDPVDAATRSRPTDLATQGLVPVRLAAVAQGPAVPVALPTRSTEIQRSLLYLRQSDPRFDRLAVDFRDGTVFLTGYTPRNGDAWDFADSARRLPGVRRVVVGAVNIR